MKRGRRYHRFCCIAFSITATLVTAKPATGLLYENHKYKCIFSHEKLPISEKAGNINMSSSWDLV